MFVFRVIYIIKWQMETGWVPRGEKERGGPVVTLNSYIAPECFQINNEPTIIIMLISRNENTFQMSILLKAHRSLGYFVGRDSGRSKI